MVASPPHRDLRLQPCMVPDVELALDCGVSGVVMEVPASHHLIEKAYRWPVEKAIEASVEATNMPTTTG